jgi:hypothetical protein
MLDENTGHKPTVICIDNYYNFSQAEHNEPIYNRKSNRLKNLNKKIWLNLLSWPSLIIGFIASVCIVHISLHFNYVSTRLAEEIRLKDDFDNSEIAIRDFIRRIYRYKQHNVLINYKEMIDTQSQLLINVVMAKKKADRLFGEEYRKKSQELIDYIDSLSFNDMMRNGETTLTASLREKQHTVDKPAEAIIAADRSELDKMPVILSLVMGIKDVKKY